MFDKTKDLKTLITINKIRVNGFFPVYSLTKLIGFKQRYLLKYRNKSRLKKVSVNLNS